MIDYSIQLSKVIVYDSMCKALMYICNNVLSKRVMFITVILCAFSWEAPSIRLRKSNYELIITRVDFACGCEER